MPIISREDFESLQFGDIIYTGHSADEDFIYGDRPEDASFFLKWFVLYRQYDLYCSLFAEHSSSYEDANTSSFGLFSIEEIATSNLQQINEKISKLDLKTSNDIDFGKSRTISIFWIQKVEKNNKDTQNTYGMHCCECGEYYSYAIPNLLDKRMACWNCRDSYRWKYNDLFIGK